MSYFITYVCEAPSQLVSNASVFMQMPPNECMVTSEIVHADRWIINGGVSDILTAEVRLVFDMPSEDIANEFIHAAIHR